MLVSCLGNEQTWDFGRVVGVGLRVSQALRSKELGRRSVIALSLPSGPEYLAALIGIWDSGGTPLCLPQTLTSNEIGSIGRRCGIDGLLACGPAEVPLSTPVVDMDDFTVGGESVDIEGRRLLDDMLRARPANDPALLLVTSGTTAEPKIVELGASALLYRLAGNVRALGRSTLRHTLCTLPMHFGHGLIGNCLTTVYANGDLTIAEDPVQAAAGFFDVLNERKITFLSSVPSFWAMATAMSRNGYGRPHELGVAGSGSSPLTSKAADGIRGMLPQTRLLDLYGLTEMANWVAGTAVRPGDHRPGQVGRCWDGRAAVLREDGTIGSSGTGEIVLRSPARMRGYRGSPDSTRRAIERGWFRTGDLGEIDASGTIVLAGRLVDQIDRAGLKLSPVAIENVLGSHPDVADVCCFGLPDELRGERVAAAVVAAVGTEPTGAGLRDWLTGRLRSDSLPESWFFVDELPRSARGKVLRDVLRRRFAGC